MAESQVEGATFLRMMLLGTWGRLVGQWEVLKGVGGSVVWGRTSKRM